MARSAALLQSRGVGGVQEALPLLTMAMHEVVRKIQVKSVA